MRNIRSKINRNNKRGFTLIEILVYFALLSIILLIIVDLFLRISEASLESTAKSRVEAEGEYVLNKLTYDIRRADGINQPPTPGDSRSFLALVIDGDIYIYFTSGSTILIGRWPSEIYSLTGNSVSASPLTFTRIQNPGGEPTVRISFNLESTDTTKQGVKSKDFETVVSLR